ncbi:DMT family transporter [Streptomyces sp. NPDC057743]|uniref:DMT family transporter n=1 Tax=Streptomyces sp. NPDC057743 TaxID=3346236 RepID=UPI003688B6A5
MLWWGVASALLANVLYSTGFVLEKRALAALPPLSTRHPARLIRHLLSSPLWLGGSLTLAAGFAAQLAVYRTLPIAAAQGIFISGLVLLLLMSSVVLGERTSGRERQSIAAILVALGLVVASLRTEDAQAIARTAPPATLLAIAVPSLTAGLLLYRSAELRARRRHRLPTAGVSYGVAIGLLYGVSSLAIKGVSGLLTFHNVPAATLTLLRSPYPYLLVVTGATGLVLSQTALQRCRASVIVPVCTTVTCVFTIACGTLAFGEPLPDAPVRLALRLGGTALALTILVILPRHEDPLRPNHTTPALPSRAAAALAPPQPPPQLPAPAAPHALTPAPPRAPIPPPPRTPALPPSPHTPALSPAHAPEPPPRSPKPPAQRTPGSSNPHTRPLPNGAAAHPTSSPTPTPTPTSSAAPKPTPTSGPRPPPGPPRTTGPPVRDGQPLNTSTGRPAKRLGRRKGQPTQEDPRDA